MQNLFRYITWYYPVRDFLYLLQLEEYALSRYVKQLKRRLFKRNFEVRGELKYTKRMRLVLAVHSILMICLVTTSFYLDWLAYILVVLLIPILTPLVIAIASLLVNPVATLLRRRVLRKAKLHFLDTHPKTYIIGITGSYGKTTTKYLLQHMLQYKYQVAIIPENINTAIGVAEYILDTSLPTQLDYLIVEMGAYQRGDIAEFTDMLPPDYSIVTALGDQHLERFGGFSNLVRAKYEIFAGTRTTGACYTTTKARDNFVAEELILRDLITVPATNSPKDNQILAAALAAALGVTDTVIADAIKTFTPPERRDNQYTVDGVLVIDNSYNISPHTSVVMLEEAKVIAEKIGKKLVVMTGGIGEQGTLSTAVNKEFALQLNQYATRVLLHPSIYAPAIQAGLSIPNLIIPQALPVLEAVAEHIDGGKEVLLHLPEHGDEAY